MKTKKKDIPRYRTRRLTCPGIGGSRFLLGPPWLEAGLERTVEIEGEAAMREGSGGNSELLPGEAIFFISLSFAVNIASFSIFCRQRIPISPSFRSLQPIEVLNSPTTAVNLC